MKHVSFMLLVGLSLVTTGCFSADTLIRLNLDGSGTVVQKMMVSTEMLAQMQAMVSGFATSAGGTAGTSGSTKPPDLFAETQVRSQAAKMGQGVSFVFSRKIKVGKMEGVEAVYAFKDINQLRVSEKPDNPALQGTQSKNGEQGKATTFRFQKLADSHAVLTIVAPVSKPRSTTEADSHQEPVLESGAESGSRRTPPSLEQMEQAKRLLEGMRFSLAVEVQGQVVQTNSPYVEGSKVTLLEMDFSQLLKNEDLSKQASFFNGQSLEDAKALLRQVKGFKVNLEPEVQIEFEGQ
jgi:hypothetical protein